MAAQQWTLDQADGELIVRTGVTGRAAKMGHRVTIAMQRWSAKVLQDGSGPTALDLTIEVEGLHVRHGVGGLRPLSTPEKAMVRQSALRVLAAGRYPEIRFHADGITATQDGYDVAGSLTIHGVTRQRVVHVNVTEDDAGTHYLCTETLRQTDFAIRPYSFLMGSIRVADEVTVTLSATRPESRISRGGDDLP